MVNILFLNAFNLVNQKFALYFFPEKSISIGISLNYFLPTSAEKGKSLKTVDKVFVEVMQMLR